MHTMVGSTLLICFGIKELFQVRMNWKRKEEELRSLSTGAGVNKVSVRKTPLAIPQGIGVGSNTTSPFAGSRHYI